MKGLRSNVKHMRQWVYANCWYMSEYESAAMWKLYARTEEAICVRSTFAKLKKLLPDKTYLGCVDYIDYNTDYVPMGHLVAPFVQKRLSFEHEKEVRAVIVDHKGHLAWSVMTRQVSKTIKQPEPPQGGIWIDVNLTELIETVYVAPTASEWFRETVELTLKKFDCPISVIRSSLDDSPIW